MSSIQVNVGNSGIVGIPVAWHDPELADVVFVVVQDGATGLADRDYMAEFAHQVWTGDVGLEATWDAVLIKTDKMPFPVPCELDFEEGDGKVTAVFRTEDGVGRYAMRI